MVSLFINILTLAVSAGVILLFLFLLQQVLGKKYSVFWRFFTCMVLAVRLMLPFSLIEAPLLWSPLDLMQTAGKQQVVFLSDKENETALTDNTDAKEPKKEDTVSSYLRGIKVSQNILHFLRAGAAIWVVGMCLYFIHLFLSWIALKKKVRRWSCKAEPAAIEVFSELCQEMHVERKIHLVQCKKVHSPMLTGLFHPYIVLPQNTYEYSQYRLLLQHELCHYIHGDLFFKYLLAVIQGMYWFVPWIHYLVRVINGDIEILCDKEVIKRNGESSRESYSRLLFDHITKEQAAIHPFTTYFYCGKRQVKERFCQLMKPQAGKKGLGLILSCIVLIGIMSSTTLSLADSTKEKMNAGTEVSDAVTVDDKAVVSKHVSQNKKSKEELPFVNRLKAAEKEENAAWNDYKEKYEEIYDVLTFRLDIADAPEVVQTWVDSCNVSSQIYVAEYENRYWIYTKAVGNGNDYQLDCTVSASNKKNRITIKPYKDANGDGYALICAPKTKKLTVRCKKHVFELGG